MSTNPITFVGAVLLLVASAQLKQGRLKRGLALFYVKLRMKEIDLLPIIHYRSLFLRWWK